MQIPPAEVILSWPTPNYVDPETRGEALLILMIFFSIFMLAAVAGRFYARIITKGWFGWDDGMMVLALIFALGMNASVILANKAYGWDRHIWDLRFTMFQDASIVAFAAKLLFVGASTFTRMSLICFYYRLVRDSGVIWFNWVLHFSMAFVVSLGIAFTCLGIWLCIPVQSYWIFPPSGDYKCLDEGTATLVVGIFNCVADLLTTLLPVPLIMRLRMPLRHRIGVCILLGLGVVVTAAGIVRTYFIWASLIDSWDETWLSYPLWICAAIEIDLAVICACAPALKSLLHKPIARLTAHISSKLSSIISPERSHGSATHTQTSSGTGTTGKGSSKLSSALRIPFRQKGSNLDSTWDRDEEYGMLRLTSDPEKHPAATTISGGPVVVDMDRARSPTGGRPAGQPTLARKGTLEIIKRQSVDMEISFLPGLAPQESPTSQMQRAPDPLELQ